MLSHRWDSWEVQFWLGTHLGSSETSTCSYPMLTWDDDRRWNFTDGTFHGISQLQMGQHRSHVPSDFIIEMWRFGITWDQMGTDLGQIMKSHEIDMGLILWHLGYTWVVFYHGRLWDILGSFVICWPAPRPIDLNDIIYLMSFLHDVQIGPWLIDFVAGKLIWNIWQRWVSNLDVLSSGGGAWAIGGGLTWPICKSSYYIHVWSRLLQLKCVLGLLRHLQALREKFIEICLHNK